MQNSFATETLARERIAKMCGQPPPALAPVVHKDVTANTMDDTAGGFLLGGKRRQPLTVPKALIVKTEGPHKFSSTQFEFSGEMAANLQALADGIDDEDLADDGRETQMHVTIKYGLHTNDAKAVADVVGGFGPVKVTLGKVSYFSGEESGKDYDVVKVDVADSPDLARLNKLISDKLQVTDTHPDYRPHVTLAYVKAGRGEVYTDSPQANTEGKSATFDKLVFSPADGEKSVIQLANAGKEFAKALGRARRFLVIPKGQSAPIKINLPDLEQHTSYSCGASCMMAISEYFGVGPETEAEFIRALGTTPADGTNPAALIALGHKLGLEVHARAGMSLDELKADVDAGKPVLVLIQAWDSTEQAQEDFDRDEDGHYVCAIGFDAERVYFEDPVLKGSRGELAYADFMDRWHDKGTDGTAYVRWGASFWREEGVEEIKGLRAKGAHFEEGKHPRDNEGRFGSGVASSPASRPDKPAGTNHTEADAEHALQKPSLLAKMRALPAKAASKAKQVAQGIYDKAEKKYGPRWAKAILVTAIVTAPTPVMTASILGMTAMAHLYTRYHPRPETKALADGAEMTQEQIEAAAKEFLDALLAELDK